MNQRKINNINKWLIIFHVMGLLLIMESIFMLISLIPSFIYGGSDAKIILLSAGITAAFGFVLFILGGKRKEFKIDRRQGFVIVALIWVVMSCFGALPLYIGRYVTTFTDAFFETMSGFTTTGATIIGNVEGLPKGVLFWRALTHWIGGIGIIVILLSFVPFMGGSGMSLYAAEVAGPTKDKISPHIEKTSKILVSIYFSLSLLCFFTYWVCGMNVYDAICQTFATVATGGFSTKNLSGGAFSPLIQYAMILFMILSGMNLVLFYNIYKREFYNIKHNEELKFYLLSILTATIIVFVSNYTYGQPAEKEFRDSLFQVSSILTSTGFVNYDYTSWSNVALFVLITLMWSGAMSGSTSGGLKMVRIILLFKNAKNIIKKGIHSNAFIPITLDKKVVHNDVMYNVLAVFLLYVIVVCISIIILSATGLPLPEAVSATLTSMGNMGPGVGRCGGFGNYEYMTDIAKWTLSIVMYVGRLEIVTVFVLFTPSFWKR